MIGISEDLHIIVLVISLIKDSGNFPKLATRSILTGGWLYESEFKLTQLATLAISTE